MRKEIIYNQNESKYYIVHDIEILKNGNSVFHLKEITSEEAMRLRNKEYYNLTIYKYTGC